MADKAARKRGAIRQGLGRRKVVAEPKDQAMGAIVRGGTEEPGHDDARGHRAPYFGVRMARERKVHVVHDKAARKSSRREMGCESRGVLQRPPSAGLHVLQRSSSHAL